MKKNKRGQEEMVGFALIIIMVAIILLVFLTISMKKTNEISESSEIENFLQSMLQYTSNCSINSNFNFVSINRLIQECSEDTYCNDGTFSCDVLNNTLEKMFSVSWSIQNTSQFRGYELMILQGTSPDPVILLTNISEGIKTNTSRGSFQPLTNYEQVYMTVYY